MCNRRKRHGLKCEGTVKVFPYAAEKANPFPFCGEVWIKDVLRQMSSICPLRDVQTRELPSPATCLVCNGTNVGGELVAVNDPVAPA